MSFVDWIFLFGGLAVAGPVIAHLLARPRFRRLPFTMLRFLHTGQVESQSRRKLRDLLILLLRCAIIVLIAMLFARPFLHVSPDPEQAENTFYVGLDNSMSMAYSDGSGSYFDKMVGQALDYVRSADADPGAPVFNICALASGRWSCDLSKEQALAEVKAMKIEPDSANVGDFLSGLGRSSSGEGVSPLSPEAVSAWHGLPARENTARMAVPQREAHDTARGRRSGGTMSVAVLSDFTPHILSQFISIEEPAAVYGIDYRLITSAEPVDNAAIVDAHIVGFADGKLTVDATVANYGRTVQDRQLKASAGPNASAPVEIRLSPNQRGSYQVQLNVSDAGRERLFLPVELSLSGSDGLKEDDTFYMGVSIPEQRNINILIAGDSPAQLFLLKTALDALSRMSPYNALKVGQVRIDDLAHSDLDWADVVVCSTIVGRLDALAADVQNFVRTGGRLICFVTERVATEAAKRLWQQDVLAAMPGKYVPGRMYPEPKPCEGRVVGVDDLAARSLVNYRIDKILLKAYLECTPHAESRCLWQLQNGAGFIYLKEYGNGTTIFVNTSIDDSLGTLTKSNASVAFCRYLLGESAQIAAYCFARNERVLLPVPEGAARVRSDAVRRFDKMPSRAHYEQQSWVQTCDGKKRQAAISGSQLLVPDPAGIGWVKTLDKPTMYAGVNLPPGETDMTGPDDAELAAVVSRVLPKHADTSSAEAGTLEIRLRKPLWRIIAWLLILLLLAEPAVANRLKR